jgi:type II secretory pathway pseudopilin PulG
VRAINTKQGAKMKRSSSSRQAGFAIVELLLVAIIVLAVAGIGYWVFQQRSTTSTAVDNTTSQTVNAKQAAAQNAATAVQKAADADANAVKSSGDADSETAQSDNAVSQQVGDSSDAAN